jgi:hypothetical protein
MSKLPIAFFLAGTVASSLTSSVLLGQELRSGSLVVKVGDSPTGVGTRTVSDLNTPFTDRDGIVGFTGRVVDELGVKTAFVWRNSGIVWLDTDAPVGFTISGQPEDSMGAGPDGRWVYSNGTVSVANGVSGDSLWVNGQFLLGEPQAAPQDAGKFIRFLSGPMMFDDGSISVIAGTASTPTGGPTTGRSLYRVHFTPLPEWTLVYKTGDSLAGKTIRFPTPGLSFTYDFSDDGVHYAHVIGLDPSTTFSDNNVILDGNILASEGGPVDNVPGGFWRTFTSVGVNNAGTAIIVGEHSQLQGRIIAVGNNMWMRQNDTVTGTNTTLNGPLVASINNAGKIASVWTVDNGEPTFDKALLVGDASGAGVDSAIIVQKRDTLDVNGDTIADFTVTDILSSSVTSRGLDFGDDGNVFVNLSLTPIGGGTAVPAIVKFVAYVACPCVADYDLSGGTPDAGDIDAFFNAWLAGEAGADADCSGGTPDAGDIDTFFTQWLNGGC